MPCEDPPSAHRSRGRQKKNLDPHGFTSTAPPEGLRLEPFPGPWSGPRRSVRTSSASVRRTPSSGPPSACWPPPPEKRGANMIPVVGADRDTSLARPKTASPAKEHRLAAYAVPQSVQRQKQGRQGDGVDGDALADLDRWLDDHHHIQSRPCERLDDGRRRPPPCRRPAPNTHPRPGAGFALVWIHVPAGASL